MAIIRQKSEPPVLTPEEIEELENAEKMPPTYDEDCPKMTSEMLKQFRCMKHVSMEELISKLKAISDVYDDFIIAVTTYAGKKPKRLLKVLNYLDQHDNLTSSDVVYFISMQPDFHEEVVDSKVQK